jgi:hypothetical protein
VTFNTLYFHVVFPSHGGLQRLHTPSRAACEQRTNGRPEGCLCDATQPSPRPVHVNHHQVRIDRDKGGINIGDSGFQMRVAPLVLLLDFFPL